MNSEPLVAVVIVHYGSATMTSECIDSVYASAYTNLAVIVVDNSTHERLTYKPLRPAHCPILIVSAENRGYAGGNNLGIHHALTLFPKYVVLLNNDAIIDSSFIRSCIAYFREHSEISIISPKILYFDAPKYINCAGGELDFKSGSMGGITMYGGDEEDCGQYNEVRDITFASGCALIVDSEVFTQIGVFDENLFCYGEDVDFSRRAIAAGLKMRYLPDATVWHKHPSVKCCLNASFDSRSTFYYEWRAAHYNRRRSLPAGRFSVMGRFWFNFVWSCTALTLKHRRLDLSISIILGVVDAVRGRMGKRDYNFLARSLQGK